MVTADALHTVKATAEQIRTQGGHFVLPVKENRRALFDVLDALPWPDRPDHAYQHRHRLRPRATATAGLTTRTIQVQLIERNVADLDGKAISALRIRPPQ